MINVQMTRTRELERQKTKGLARDGCEYIQQAAGYSSSEGVANIGGSGFMEHCIA